MNTISRKVNCLLVLCCFLFAVCAQVDQHVPAEGQRSVDEFRRLLASLFNGQSSREKDLNTDYLAAVNQHFGNLPSSSPNRPPYRLPGTGYPPENGAAGFGLRPRPPPQRPPYYPQGPYLPDYEPPDQSHPPLGPFPNRPPRPFPTRPLGPDGYPRPPPPDGYPQPGPNEYPSPLGPEGYPRPPRPGGHPPPPPLPPGYRPPSGPYPQGSFIGALGSISRYDDLRCVPRLLCEITSGGRKTSSGPYKAEKDSDSAPGSFISKDAIVTLLTVLNFVDDSPLLLFARAAFLGYSSKGDTQTCLTAYPTCPRDPDQLVDYLNNHNGGFFRFFNQQLQQQPQYQSYAQKYADTSADQNHQSQSPSRPDDGNAHRFTPREPPHAAGGANSRILNDPIDIDYVGSAQTSASFPTRQRRPQKVVFHSEEQTAADDQPQESNGNQYNSVFVVRGGKKLAFPGRADKGSGSGSSSGMIFPDRTGTGNLILSSDVSGHYKIVFANEEHGNLKKSRKIKFQTDLQRSDTRMKFPDEAE